MPPARPAWGFFLRLGAGYRGGGGSGGSAKVRCQSAGGSPDRRTPPGLFPGGPEKLAQAAAARQINRVVVAACTPQSNEPRLREAFRRVGINKYLVETVNIRGEVAWVHPDDKAKATAKAKDLIRAAVARVLTLKPLAERPLHLEQQALVVGGGVAGLNAALNLAEQGVDVYLIEKDKKLGGLARKIHRTIEGMKVKDYLDQLIYDVIANERIEVLTDTEIVRHLGSKGNFLTTVAGGTDRVERSLKHGAMIVATGAREYVPGILVQARIRG